MSGQTRAALRDLAELLVIACFCAGLITFALGLGFLGIASLKGVAAPNWAALFRDIGAIGMGFCLVGYGAIETASALSWLPSRKNEKFGTRTPKDAA
jgi:hypothetical protein